MSILKKILFFGSDAEFKLLCNKFPNIGHYDTMTLRKGV